MINRLIASIVDRIDVCIKRTAFEWSPSSHRLIAHSYRSFTRSVIELLMIRGISDASSITPWLPNELMFEIFRALFDLYNRQSR